MSRIYLIRHGQAGLRHNYDTLSPIGEQQAGLLRAWFHSEGIKFNRIISGSRTRQIETACLAAGEPEIIPGFTEFDLDVVYAGIAPMLCKLDPRFDREYREMLAEMKADDAPVHRQWNRCDAMVFQAWHGGKYAVEGESWVEFKTRVLATLDALQSSGPDSQIAVFTSATPIGLLLARILGSEDEQAMFLAGACYNSSITTLRIRDGQARMTGFNSIAHLTDPALRTLR